MTLAGGMPGRATTIGATLCALCLAAGCGAQSPTAVRVGREMIDEATVAHWAEVIERGGAPGDFHGEAHGTPRQRSLAFLISSRWLGGEAASLGSPISDGEVNRALDERELDEGRSEFEESLAGSGESTADAKLEIKTKLAAAAIRRRLAQQAAQLTQAEIESYYERNSLLFRHHEARNVDLIENLASPVAARALVRRIGTGAAFSKLASHEALAHNIAPNYEAPTKEAILRAIFAARAGVVSPPVRTRHGWAVFIVRKISPASIKPLDTVRAQVVELLTAKRERELTEVFKREYEARWRARTSCSRGYVVRGCAQYAGPVAVEEAPF
jgi:foldase protein PrsA